MIFWEVISNRKNIWHLPKKLRISQNVIYFISHVTLYSVQPFHWEMDAILSWNEGHRTERDRKAWEQWVSQLVSGSRAGWSCPGRGDGRHRLFFVPPTLRWRVFSFLFPLVPSVSGPGPSFPPEQPIPSSFLPSAPASPNQASVTFVAEHSSSPPSA